MITLDVRSLSDALEQLPPYAPEKLLNLFLHERTHQKREQPLLAKLDPAEVQAAITEADRIGKTTESLAKVLTNLTPIPAETPMPEFGL